MMGSGTTNCWMVTGSSLMPMVGKSAERSIYLAETLLLMISLHFVGDHYEGAYRDGVRCGEGKLTYSHGDCYAGEFANGLPNGAGTLTYANGDYYHGNFLNGKRHGLGEHTYSSTGRKSSSVCHPCAYLLLYVLYYYTYVCASQRKSMWGSTLVARRRGLAG
jgi:hypothetical protein